MIVDTDEAAMDAAEAARYRALLEEAVAHPQPYPEGCFEGRGIVICGGGETYFTCAWVCIGRLRQLGCTLSIELWYRGRAEMNEAMLALMASIDVTCVDAYAVVRRHPVRRLDGWELKPFAIAYSRFEQLLYLDADNVPVRDPTPLFEAAEFARTGAVFWPDRFTGASRAQEWLKRSAWEVCGVPWRPEPEIETGQLLVAKRRSWRALMLCLHLNEHSDFYYAHFYGDKDTFRLAWHRLAMPFALVPHPVRNLGGSAVIVQHGFDGRVLFQHRNGDKWSLTHRPKRLRGFLGARACLALLAELGRRWQPPVRELPRDFIAAEADLYRRVCAVGRYAYRVGVATRVLELRPDFTIGRGAATMEVGWSIEEDKDGICVLAIRNAGGVTGFLRQDDAGIWRGRWRVYDRARISLTPASASLVAAADLPLPASSRAAPSAARPLHRRLVNRLAAACRLIR